jgi:hypothetical protein
MSPSLFPPFAINLDPEIHMHTRLSDLEIGS